MWPLRQRADPAWQEGVEAPERRPLPLPARIGAALVAIGLFVGALGLMKAGASALIPSLEGSQFTDNAWSTLGMGWLGACLVLSGSPIAAASLTLLTAGAISRSESFTMLTGSRLGASFVVLVVGAVYAFRRQRGSGRRTPLTTGIMALCMTFIAYVPGAFLGWVALTRGWLDGINLSASPDLVSVTDSLFGWMVDAADAVLPGWALFPAGLVVLLGAFKILDFALPSIDQLKVGSHPSAWYRRTWPMFALGCAVAMVTLSVSVALTLLVPLVAKDYLRREDVLPYIAGANITTLADTLVAAVVLGNPDAVRVVIAEVLGVGVWTILLLAVAYPLVRRIALRVTSKVLSSQRRLLVFLAVLFSVPVLLILA